MYSFLVGLASKQEKSHQILLNIKVPKENTTSFYLLSGLNYLLMIKDV